MNRKAELGGITLFIIVLIFAMVVSYCIVYLPSNVKSWTCKDTYDIGIVKDFNCDGLNCKVELTNSNIIQLSSGLYHNSKSNKLESGSVIEDYCGSYRVKEVRKK